MGISQKGWIILTTLILISLIFVFYFLVYVKGNERKIVEDNFRVLENMKNNITNLLESERRIVEIRVPKLYEKVNSIKDGNLSTIPKTMSINDTINRLVNQYLHKLYPGLLLPDGSKDTHYSNNIFYTWEIKDENKNKYLYKKSYQDIFKNDLIERKDVFEFITISKVFDGKLKTLFSNFPLGHIYHSKDTATINKYTSKNLFEIDFGYDQYLAFNAQLNGEEDYNVVLTGYVNKVNFNDKKREVSVFFITFSIILTILMILAFPILKLRIMSKKERLNRVDVFLTGVSLVIAPSILILFSLFYSNLLSDRSIEKDKLTYLNKKLNKNFQSEIDKAIIKCKDLNNQLFDNLDLERMKDTKNSKIEFKNNSPFKNLGEFKDDRYEITDAWDKDILKNGSKSDFRYFNSIFWTDPTGKVKIIINSKNEFTSPQYLNHRRYVMDIANDNILNYKNHKIAIESIRSVLDGNYEIGLGIDSGHKKIPVLATSFSLASLMDPIMEEGYGFCIFNSQGLTLFHSEIMRNRNENFLSETGGVLNAYVKSGISKFFSINYMNKDHYMYLNKIQELDGFYLATFVNKSYIHSPNAIAIYITIEMLLAFLVLLFVFYIILYGINCKKNKLKKRSYIFNWIKPFININNSAIYSKLLLTNILFCVYLTINYIIFCRYEDIIIFNLICSGMLFITLHFWKLSKYLPENERIYVKSDENNKFSSLSIVLTIVILFMIIGKSYIIIMGTPLGWLDIFLFVLALTCVFLILSHKKRNAIKLNLKSYFKIINLPYYKLYLLSIIFALTILPLLVFYSINHKKEKEILFKNNTVALERSIRKWNDIKKEQFYKQENSVQNPLVNNLNGFIKNMSKDRLNYAIDSTINFQNICKIYPPDSSLFDQLYDKARFSFDLYRLNSQGFVTNGDTSKWVYNNGGVDFNNSIEKNRISGQIMSFSIFCLLANLLILFLILYFIFGLLNNVIDKIFCLQYKNYSDKLVLNKPYSEIAKKLISVYSKADSYKDSFNNSFIVGINASHVYEIKNALESWKKSRFFCIEFLNLSNVLDNQIINPYEDVEGFFSNLDLNFKVFIKSLINSNSGNYNMLIDALKDKHQLPNSTLMVFIEHFEFSYDNIYLNKVKLNILQRLVSNPSIRVVISSEISPVKVYEFYKDSIKKLEKMVLKCQGDPLENKKKIDDLSSDYKNWLHLLGGFFRITVPIEKIQSENKNPILNEELEHGQYLKRLNNKYYELFGDNDSPNLQQDDYILNIQETSYSYYFAIWNSLSKEERYIVYDIAHDNFVNSNNVDGIIDLLQKGILIYDHSLRLMNESFTNFVLTKINSDEALERELESTKGGKWNTVSAVILLVIISLIVFISFGKINILEDVNALLGSLAAVFSLLIRMGGIFVFNKKTV